MAMEVKMYCRKKNSGKTQQFDHIPKWFQLPRSASTSKPRTEFFLPICSSKGMSSVTVRSSDMSNDKIGHTIDLENRKQEMMTNGIQLPVTSVKSFGQKTQIQPCSNRINEDRNDALEFTPNRLQVTESSEVCTTPGQIERDNSSSSGRARSKRERKPKVHFDEVSYPLYTSRKNRRFKIMRSLGLAAPVGSPFNSS